MSVRHGDRVLDQAEAVSDALLQDRLSLRALLSQSTSNKVRCILQDLESEVSGLRGSPQVGGEREKEKFGGGEER